MKKIGIAIIISAVVFTWHLVISHSMENEFYTINPITDVATLKMPSAASYGITDADAVASFNGGRDLTGIPGAEHKLNLYARQHLDLFAMIVSYRVIIIDK
jgi:hypothetical protein